MNKKVVIIVASVLLVTIAAVGVVVGLFMFKNKSYRVLKIFEYEGTAAVVRESIGEIEPYINMILESGDKVSLERGTLVLKADEDKFIHLENGTSIVINASGTAENSKTTIELLNGAITNDVQNKLTDESSYEIHTPNSTMSVRGTVFRVWMWEENGIKYTKISVFDGEVVSKLVYSDGTVSDDEVSIAKGKEVVIYEDGTTTDYLTDTTDIIYEDLPSGVVELLIDVVDDGRTLVPTKKELEAILEKKITITYMYNGQVFGVKEATKGDVLVRPALTPTQSGDWNWNFQDRAEEDMVIEWN